MELVYLWVEEYKNIKKEGFNFSPHFTCTYDKDNNKLIIDDENENYRGIFPKDINVTVIVGENGSGKSSIFKIILYLFAIYFGERETDLDAGGKYFLIIKTEEGYRLLKNNFQDIECNKSFKKLTQREFNFYSIYVNYMMDSLKDGHHEKWVDEFYYRNDNYKTPILLEPNKRDNKIDLDSLDYIAEQRFDWQFLVGELNDTIQSFFNPSWVRVDENISKIIYKLERLNHTSFDNPILKNMNNSHPFVKDKTWNDLDKVFKQATKDLKQEVGELFQKEEYSKINTIYFALKILSTGLVGVNIFEELVKVVESEDLLNELIGVIETRGLENIYKEDIEKCESITFATKDKLRYCVDFKNIEDTISKRDLCNCMFELEKRDEFSKRLRSYPMWITKTYYEGDKLPFDKSLANLSSGEKTYLKFLMMLVYEIEQISTNGENKYQTMNFFLDEVELSMHPNWQKRLLKDILKIFENSNLKFNLFITSHSPFILSDVPKKNVIFLKDGKHKSVNIETFGANIHTLLSNGFFMKDGLMGEFAKEKINEVIENLLDKSKSLSKYQIKTIIEMVGEPFVKAKLNQMYSEKFGLDNEIEILKKQQEEINKKIEYLNKKKNDNVES